MRILIIIFLLITPPCFCYALSNKSGIICGNSVRVREKPDISAKIISELNTGDLVEILAQDPKEVMINKSREFFYHWYKVLTQDKKEGWVYGQYLYTYINSEPLLKPVVINGTAFKLVLFSENAISHLMPDHDQYTLPCFYDPVKNRAYPIYASSSVHPFIMHSTDTSNIFKLINNTSNSEYIDEISLIEPSSRYIYINISCSFQVGGGSYTLVVVQQNNGFSVINVKNVKRRNVHEN